MDLCMGATHCLTSNSDPLQIGLECHQGDLHFIKMYAFGGFLRNHLINARHRMGAAGLVAWPGGPHAPWFQAAKINQAR